MAVKFCTSCGEKVASPTNKFCAGCGQALPQPAPTPAAAAPSAPSPAAAPPAPTPAAAPPVTASSVAAVLAPIGAAVASAFALPSKPPRVGTLWDAIESVVLPTAPPPTSPVGAAAAGAPRLSMWDAIEQELVGKK